jgi:hypothetical protein
MFIDSYQNDWLDVLAEHDAALDDGAALYLLADGVFVPGMYLEMRAALGGEAVTLLFESLPGCSAAVRAVSPFLFRYVAGAANLRALLAKCSGWPMLCAISTQETLAELTTRLSAWRVIYADGQRFNFRFPDTRRLPGIFAALTVEQQGQLAGPATHWSYMARNGTWSELPLLAPSMPAPTDYPELNAPQFGRMVSDSEADNILSNLSVQGRLPVLRASQLHLTVTRALRLADVTGLPPVHRSDWCEACLADTGVLDDVAMTNKMQYWQTTLLT